LISHRWSINKVITGFGVSEYTERKGTALQKTCGILPELEKKKRWPLFDALIQSRIQFHKNDEYSCLCPGMDFVSVKQQREEITY
jgi:hypothetical protein